MRLIADIGGTNARFALAAADGTMHAKQILPVASFPRFEDALAAYRADADTPIGSVAISAAGPVTDGRVHMTNAAWEISPEAVRAVCGDVAVHILNDLAAVAMAVPGFGPADTAPVLAGRAAGALAPMLCVNVGTGFGAAVAVPVTGGWTTLATEAGHMTLAWADAAERAALGPGPTVEEVFSGPALHRLRQRHGTQAEAAAAFRHVFSYVFGRVTGDLALATGAWGGVYLCGGVLTHLAEVVEIEAFSTGFTARSGLAQRLTDVPVRHITAAEPAFLGLQRI